VQGATSAHVHSIPCIAASIEWSSCPPSPRQSTSTAPRDFPMFVSGKQRHRALQVCERSHPHRSFSIVYAVYVWLPHILTPVGRTKEVRAYCAISSVISAVRCRWRMFLSRPLTLILLVWRIWWGPNNGSKWQTGFNSAFKGLNLQGAGHPGQAHVSHASRSAYTLHGNSAVTDYLYARRHFGSTLLQSFHIRNAKDALW